MVLSLKAPCIYSSLNLFSTLQRFFPNAFYAKNDTLEDVIVRKIKKALVNLCCELRFLPGLSDVNVVLYFVVAYPTLVNVIVTSLQRFRKNIFEIYRGNHHIAFNNFHYNNIQSDSKTYWFVEFVMIFFKHISWQNQPASICRYNEEVYHC